MQAQENNIFGRAHEVDRRNVKLNSCDENAQINVNHTRRSEKKHPYYFSKK